MDTKQMQAPPIYGREEVPAKLKISQRYADELMATGQLGSFKIGKRRVCTERQLADFIRKHELAGK